MLTLPSTRESAEVSRSGTCLAVWWAVFGMVLGVQQGVDDVLGRMAN